VHIDQTPLARTVRDLEDQRACNCSCALHASCT
jgi:hypothetical protein